MKTNIIKFPEAKPGRPRKYKIKGRQVGPDYQPEGEWNPLSNGQKARLALLAKKAAQLQYLPDTGKEHNAWRQETSLRLAKVRISEARQRDWNDLHAIWLDLAGESGKAFKTLMRADGNPRRVAHFKLTKLLKEKGLSEGYAEKICLAKHKCALADASAPQIWKIFFDIRNRHSATA